MVIDIPNYKKLDIRHIVLDYNGTLAKDGILKEEVKRLLPKLCKEYMLHVITADTFGSVHDQLADFDVKIEVLKSLDHTREKADFIESLCPSFCAAVGNGNNDVKMIEKAELGISLCGDEGCALTALRAGDILCFSIEDALILFLNRKRLIATLRK
jgi:soluble P-type ATPase